MLALTSDFPVPGGALFAKTLLEEMLMDKERDYMRTVFRIVMPKIAKMEDELRRLNSIKDKAMQESVRGNHGDPLYKSSRKGEIDTLKIAGQLGLGLTPEQEKLLLQFQSQKANIDKAIALLKGMLSIMSGEDPIEIAVAFNIPQNRMEGLMALAKGDLDGAVQLAQSFGNFSPTDAEKLQRLIKSVMSFTGSTSNKGTGMKNMNLQTASARIVQCNAVKRCAGRRA